MTANTEQQTPATSEISETTLQSLDTPSIRKRGKKALTVSTIVLTTIAGGAVAASAADFGGLVNLVSPVISQYTEQDISQYASYLSTFGNVVSSVQSGDYISAASSIGYTLGDAGVQIPTQLTQNVKKSVETNYANRKIGGTYGVSKSMSQDYTQKTAENATHRAYIESVLGTEGQSNIKKSLEAGSSLAKNTSELATSSSKSTTSQKILQNISSQLAVDTVANAQLHSELVQMRIGQTQQTEILSGIKETADENEISKETAQLGQTAASDGSSGVFAGLATRSSGSSSASASVETAKSASSQSLLSTK
jgi:hypothetical protein